MAMPRGARLALYAIGAVALVIVLAVAGFALTFDPNKYKPAIIEQVKDRYQRTLAIEGDLGVTLFPRLGVSLGRTSLSAVASADRFAAVERASVSLALGPLLARRVVIDRVRLEGLEANLVKHKDGSTNYDDLIGAKKPSAPSAPSPTGGGGFAVELSGVDVRNAQVHWRDEAGGTDVQVIGMDLSTGPIGTDAPGKLTLKGRIVGTQPKIAATVSGSSGYRADLAAGAVALDNLDLRVSGDLPGLAGLEANLSGSASYDPKANVVSLANMLLAAKYADGTLTVRSGDARGSLSALAVPGFSVELDVRPGALHAAGTVRSPLALSMAKKELRLEKIDGTLTLAGPALAAGPLKLALAGRAGVDWGDERADAALTARFDETNARADFEVRGFAKPAITFDVNADKLNVDRYRGGSGRAPVSGGKAPDSDGAKGAAPARETPIDLAPLRTLAASGKLHVGALTVAGLQAQSVRAAVKAGGGRLELSPVSASLYQGTLAAGVIVNALANGYSAHADLQGVSIGPLLRDAMQRDPLEGRATIKANVTTSGDTPSALKHALGGTADLSIRDGAVKGINLAEIARKARALRKGGVESMAAVKSEKTDFSEMTAHFDIARGVAHNRDLSVKSPFLRVTGAGDINLAESALAYTVKAQVVSTATGQDGKAAADTGLQLTIPVKLSGHFDAIAWEIDYQSMLADAAKDEVRRRLEGAVGKQLDDRLKERLGEGVGGKLGDQLRGLLKR